MDNIFDENEIAQCYHTLAEKYDSEILGGPETRLLNKIFRSTLLDFIPQSSCKILDAGGGTGFHSIPLALSGHAVTIVDISMEMLKEARKKSHLQHVSEGVHLVQGNMEHIPFPDSYFDIVICHLAFVHVSHPREALAELRRMLKADGILFLTVENRHWHVLAHALRGDFAEALKLLQSKDSIIAYRSLPKIRLFTKDEMLRMHAAVGLTPIRIKGIRNVQSYIHLLRGLPSQLEELEALEMRLCEIEDLSVTARHLCFISKPISAE